MLSHFVMNGIIENYQKFLSLIAKKVPFLFLSVGHIVECSAQDISQPVFGTGSISFIK